MTVDNIHIAQTGLAQSVEKTGDVRPFVAKLCMFALALLGLVSGARADLVAQYTFDDGTATDVSGNGNDGTLLGTATVVSDPERGEVLSLDGAAGKVDLGNPASLNIVGECTIMAWVNSAVVPQTQSNAGIVQRGHESSTVKREFVLRIGTSGTIYDFGTWSPNQHASLVVPAEDENAWVHLAGTMTDNGDATWTYRLYRNGELVNTLSTATTGLQADFTVGWAIGARGGVSDFQRVFNGMIDDVRMYDNPLTLEEIQLAMIGTTVRAHTPSPASGATFVETDATLSWYAPDDPNDETVTYDVYFGTNADCDLNPLVSGDQLATTYDPGPLAFNTTYYWRVDVIDPNGGGDPIVVQGNCWSFTTCTAEPVIIEDPEGLTVESGDTAVFTVDSTCGATDWQWKKDGVNLADGGDISGATTDTLTINNVELADEGNYSVVVSNGSGSDTSAEAQLLTCRLVGHWKLDGDLLDSVQDTVPGAPTHDGQVTAGADAGETFAAGIDGQAFTFTGDPNNNVVEIVDSTDYFNFFPRGFTVSAWINDPNANGDYNGLVSKQEECCNNVATGWTLDITPGQEGVIAIRNIGSIGNGPSQAVGVDTWHLLTATYDVATGVRRLYLDGLLSVEATSVVLPVASDGPVVFGAEDVLGQVGYDGLLDDVRIYSCPLTAIEVATLYTNFVSEALDVDKVRVKAGKDRGFPEDMIIIQGDLDVEEASYNAATSIFVRISTDDFAGSYERTIPAPSSEEVLPELKNGSVRFKGVGDPDADTGQLQLQLKFNRNGRTGKYKIIGKKIDLSGLEATGANPMVIEVLFGNFSGSAELVEDADDVIINSKQSMPMCLLSGLKDNVGVDKVVARPDQVKLNKGQISALNPDLDLSGVDVTVFWDLFGETIPAGQMVDKGNGKFIYTKPRDADADRKAKKLQIDLTKCQLKLQITEGENLTSTGSAIFGLQAGVGGDAFDASIVVDLPD